MSLQVWMPLCSDLKNQGLDGSVSAFTMTVASPAYVDGKIGKCLRISNTYTNTHTFESLKNINNFSVAYWIKMNSGNTFTAFADAITMWITDGTNETTFRLETTNTSGTVLNWYGNGMMTEDGGAGAIEVNVDTWYHFAVTVDGTLIKTYFNGVLYKTYTIPSDYQSSYRLTGKMMLGSSGMYCDLNDVRIYDHVLSALEIKELSKGLMLHYKLSGIGGENLFKDTRAEKTNNDYMFTQYAPVTPLTPGETYTATMCVTPATNVTHYGLYFSSGYVGGSVLSVKGSRRQVVKKVFTMPNYYSGKTPDDNIAYAYAQFYRFPNDGTVTTNSTVHWVKIEKGNKATPWCPNSADTLYSTLGFDDGVEYDCSGYENNGTKYGTIVWGASTRRYTGSYYFSGNTSYIKTPTLSTTGCADSYTISYWGKISNTTGLMAFGFANGNRLNVYPTGVFCWNTGDGSSNPFKDSSGGSINNSNYNGAWHHYTITGDGTTTTFYIDGEKKGTATTYKPITGTQIIISGWSSGTEYKWENGYLSDFRLYATCLSESDVKSLHETSASVGKNGVFFAHEFVEEE